MDESIKKILVPMCHHNLHWTLLEYDCEKMVFNHYNSSKAEWGGICYPHACKMADYMYVPINVYLLEKNKVTMKNVIVNECEAPQQGGSPDCLLFVMHFMKMMSKRKYVGVPLGDDEEVQAKIRNKRVPLACKLLKASPPEISWQMT